MSRRLRVERVVGDAGYGTGWVVLGPDGGQALGERSTWADAMHLAEWLLEQVAR